MLVELSGNGLEYAILLRRYGGEGAEAFFQPANSAEIFGATGYGYEGGETRNLDGGSFDRRRANGDAGISRPRAIRRTRKHGPRSGPRDDKGDA